MRKTLGLEQRDLLERLDLGDRSLNMVSVFETGKSKKINADLLIGIVRLVVSSGYSLKWFFLGEGPERHEEVKLTNGELLQEVADRNLLPKLEQAIDELKSRLKEIH